MAKATLEEEHCCPDCFSDEAVRQFVIDHGKAAKGATCSYCGSKAKHSIHVSKLTDKFEKVIQALYCQSASLTQYGHIDWEDCETLETLLQEDHSVFSDSVAGQPKLLNHILANGNVFDPREGGGVTYDECDWHRQEDDWAHWDVSSNWVEIRGEVLKFGHSADFENNRPAGIDFHAAHAFASLVKSLHKATEKLPKGSLMWRARLDHHTSPDQLGAPPPEVAEAARGNMKGQPVLYLARDRKTAVCEVRPAMGQEVTLAQFRTVRDLKLCSLAGDGGHCSPFEGISRFKHLQELAQTRWALGMDLAKPVTPDQEAREYLPTQYLSNVIRALGFDGITYPSAQRGQNPRSTGANILLFDPSAALLHGKTSHVTVRKVAYKYDTTPAQS